MERTSAHSVALGGMLAALAVVIMCLGTVIPVMTYAAPLLAIVLLAVVLRSCGRRVGWAWYVCVAVLALLLCPDREAAVVFCAFGYYPLVRPHLQKIPSPFLRNLAKFCVFQLSILAVAAFTVYMLGLEAILSDLSPATVAAEAVFWLLCNLCLFLADTVLGRVEVLRRKR